MFNQGSLKELDDYKNKLSEVFQYITDFNASKRTQQAQSILNIDVSEYEKAVSIYDELLQKDSELTKEAAKKQAISDAFQDASDSLRDYADANDMTAESVSKFQQRQTAAIDAMQKTSLGARVASVGVGLLTSALTAAGIAFVTMAAQWAWDNLITPIETAAEKAQELRQEAESLQSEVDSLNSELQTTNDRIAELQAKGHLTFTEQGELANLQAQREELERILAVQEKLAENALNEANKAAVDYFNQSGVYMKPTGDTVTNRNQEFGYGNILEQTQSYMDYVDNLTDNLRQLRQEQAELEKSGDTAGIEYQNLSNRIATATSEIDKYNSKIDENVSAMQEQGQYLKEGTQTFTDYNDVLNRYLAEDDLGKMFENVVSSNSLERVDAYFQRMAEVGRLTPEMIAQSEEYANAITQEGLSAEEASEHYYAIAEAKQTAANAPQPDIDFSDFEDADEALKQVIEDMGVINSTELNAAHFEVEGMDASLWQEFIDYCNEYNLSVEEAIEKAEELGYVSSDAVSGIASSFADAATGTQSLVAGLAGVQQRMDVLIGAYQSLANGEKLSASTMQELLNYYPQLESELMQYLTGMRTHTELMADLEELYQLDLDNWNALLTAKLENDSEFWAQWLSNNETWVDEFASAYGVDLSNYTSYAQAKMALMQAMINMQNMEVIGGRETTVDDTGAIVTGQQRVQDAVNVTEDAVNALEDAFKQAQSVSFNSLEGQFGSLQSAIDSTANSARDAASAIRSIASSSLSQINGLMDMTISMLKQDLQNQLDGIDASLDAMQDNYNAQKDNIEANRDAALDSIEDQIDALRDQKDAQDDMYDAQIDALRDAQDAQDKIYEDQIDALEDELDAYNKIIDAQIEMIRLKEEQHDYDNELADKQKEVADIEAQLAELGLDDSIEAQKQRLELEEELAEKKEELEEFQHDKNIEDQITALENEKKQYEEEQQAAIDRIEAEKEAYDEMISVKIEGIQKAKEAFDDSIEAEINAMQDQKDRMQDYYDSQLANLQRNYEADRAAAEAQKERIQAQINDEAALRQQAIELIEGRSQEFYNRLIEWNRQYGTGIDADVTLKWNNAYAALETFGGKQFDVLSVMNDLTFAADGFTASLSEAVAEAGNLQSALQGVLNMQSTVAKFNQASMIDAATSHGASPGGKPTPFAKYHEGGEVGKDNTISYKQFRTYMENLKSDEIPAILQKKEWVLTEEQQGNILKLAQNQQEIIDSFTRMYSSLSSALPDNDLSSLNRTLSTNGIPEMPESVSAVSGSEPINFFISTEITGNADDSVMDDWFAKNSEAFQDRFARYTLERINYKRSLRTVR